MLRGSEGVPGCGVRMHPALSCEGPQRATALGPLLQGQPTRRLAPRGEIKASAQFRLGVAGNGRRDYRR
jgi:hypothetical protein